jgi:cytochrome c556
MDCAMKTTKNLAMLMSAALMFGVGTASAADPETQAQLDAIKAAIPKFAVPMREVGDRFQDMYFAAKGGNWALAAYMSKYMNAAMNPARLTKPKEYTDWKEFYEKDFAAVNAAIQAKDSKGFNKAYTDTIGACNQCHQSMEYGFIRVVKQANPSDNGINYTKKSEPGDVPK